MEREAQEIGRTVDDLLEFRSMFGMDATSHPVGARGHSGKEVFLGGELNKVPMDDELGQ